MLLFCLGYVRLVHRILAIDGYSSDLKPLKSSTFKTHETNAVIQFQRPWEL
jgi:hypothetical protein